MLNRMSRTHALMMALLMLGACSKPETPPAESSTDEEIVAAAAPNSEEVETLPNELVKDDTSTSVSKEESVPPQTEAADTREENGEPKASEVSKTAVKPEQQLALWVVDYDRSILGFSGTQVQKPFSGEFESFIANIRFDPANLDASTIEVIVETVSAKTGDKQRDDALPGEDWFNVKTHPRAVFRSTSITTGVEAGQYEAAGILTIRDISKEIILPFSLAVEGNEAKAEGGVQLFRNGFDVGVGQWKNGDWVSLIVDVNFTIQASKN